LSFLSFLTFGWVLRDSPSQLWLFLFYLFSLLQGLNSTLHISDFSFSSVSLSCGICKRFWKACERTCIKTGRWERWRVGRAANYFDHYQYYFGCDMTSVLCDAMSICVYAVHMLYIPLPSKHK